MLTGHTGFKGSWMTLLLNELGARVHGYALDPDPDPCLYNAANIADLVDSDIRADLADRQRLLAQMQHVQPSVVFHLAAQPLVRASYGDPIGTFATNVMGTAHVLEAVRATPSVRAVVIVTTDKVYTNDGSGRPFIESDALGGDDPYSASKAAAEIVSASYRHSFFTGPDHAHIATARAGNVIGGGDWAADRLVPDCLAAFAAKRPVNLRYPHAIRPWQHVLEPLSGYLSLAEHLLRENGRAFARAWNFGPLDVDQATVGEVATSLAALWGAQAQVKFESDLEPLHEATALRLDGRQAYEHLGWGPRWSLNYALAQTVAWQQAWLAGQDMAEVCRDQAREYMTSARHG
jgi:CDP-glucose 4,6-dehydratase